MRKAENAMSRDDVAAGRRRLHITVCQSVRSHHASGVDNAASLDWQTLLNGLFHPREADHYAKTTGRNPEYINEQWIELPISMGNSCNYCEQYTRASSGV